MQVTLTDGVTPVVICHGSDFAGQSGKYVGPLNEAVTEIEWTVRAKRPVRGASEIPLDGKLAVRTYPLSVYVECESEAAATALREGLADTLPRDGASLEVLHSAHVLDTYDPAVLQKLRIVQSGVALLIDYVFRTSTPVRTDPDPA